MIKTWVDGANAAIREMDACAEKQVQVLHHNDADGLTSGAILTRALQRRGYEVRRYCLEKPYPAVLRRVFEQEGKVLIFTDFAGRIAPLLSDLNAGRNLVLILDHHVAEPSTDPKVHNLDPDLFGLKGDRDISASTTCYLFALELNAENRDLAHLAAIGAVADGFFVGGALVSENREVALEAVRQGTLQIRPAAVGEEYFLSGSMGSLPVLDLGDYLDVLGGVGYYKGGPDMGVRVCLDGISRDSDSMADSLKEIRTRIFENETERLQAGGLKETAHIQWFDVGTRFFPMGVKMIGAFCDAIKDTRLVNAGKYLAGFQRIPDEIPGFGEIKFGEVKVSMRVAARMEEAIRSGRMMGLNILLPEATARLDGFSDACHSLTAATTVGIGKESLLIDEMEKILQGGQRG